MLTSVKSWGWWIDVTCVWLCLCAVGYSQQVYNIPPDQPGPQQDGDVYNIFDVAAFPLGFIDADITANIYGGEHSGDFWYRIGDLHPALEDTLTVNFYGGVLNSVQVVGGATVNVVGGEFGTRQGMGVNVSDGTINQFGGEIGDIRLVPFPSPVRFEVAGGTFGIISGFGDYQELVIHGDEFFVNGAAFTGFESGELAAVQAINMGDRLSGVLADGTPFAIANGALSLSTDFFRGPTQVRLIKSELPDVGPLQIDVPDQVAPAGIRAGQTLTLHASGTLPRNFGLGRSGTLVLNGGTVPDNLEISGGELRLQAGEVGRLLALDDSSIIQTGGYAKGQMTLLNTSWELSGGEAYDASLIGGVTATIQGGRLRRLFTQGTNAVTVLGTEFSVDGVPVAGLSQPGTQIEIVVPQHAQFTGTLADGTPWGLLTEWSELRVTLERSDDLPPPSPAVITVPEQLAPAAIREGQRVVVSESGELPDRFYAGAGTEVVFTGGNGGSEMKWIDAAVQLQGGQVGHGTRAFYGTMVTQSGGVVGNVTQMLAGSSWHLSGGEIGEELEVLNDASLRVSGGRIGAGLRIEPEAQLSLDVVEFYLNGQRIAGLDTVGDQIEIALPAGSQLGGTLADGSSVVFYPERGDDIQTPQVSLSRGSDLPTVVEDIVIPGAAVPTSIRRGQTLVVHPEGFLPTGFVAGPGSNVRVQEGTLGDSIVAHRASVRVDGTIGADFHAIDSDVTLSNGTIGPDFQAFGASRVSILGGTIGEGFVAHPGSHVRVTGGELLGFTADGATVDMEGASIAHSVVANDVQLRVAGPAVSRIDITEAGRTTVSHGSELGYVKVVGAGRLVLADGTIDRIDASGANPIVDLVGGTITGQMQIGNGGELNYYGTRMATELRTSFGTTFNIHEGVFEGDVLLGGTSEQPLSPRLIQVLGGTLQADILWLEGPSVVELRRGALGSKTNGSIQYHGGLLTPSFHGRSGSVTFHGTSFWIDDVPVESLVALGDSLELTAGSWSRLTAIMRDGEQYTYTRDQFLPILPSNAPTVVTLVLDEPYLDLDFNGDDEINVWDLDALTVALWRGTDDLLFDITGDDQVDLADRDLWLESAASLHLGPGARYLLGDANLDGTVDDTDLAIWSASRFTEIGRWSFGDFTADGLVDIYDFQQWNANKYLTSLPTAAVPEPGAVLMWVVGLGAIWRRRRS